MYLGPIVFLAAGFFLVRSADELASLARWGLPKLLAAARRAWGELKRRAWLAASLLILTAGAGYAVAAELSSYEGDTRFGETRNIDDVLALLDGMARPDDLVYTSRYLSPPAMFYHKEKRDNFHYGAEVCEPSLAAGCVPEMLTAFDAAGASRIWIVHKGWETLPADIANPIFASERIVGEGDARLVLIANGRMASALLSNGEGADDDLETRILKRWERIVPDEPIISANYDVYLMNPAMIYARKPCAEPDTRGSFLLSVFPVRQDDVTEHMRGKGFIHNSLNFGFRDYGAMVDGACVILRILPEYPIAAIETGQWIPGEGGLWGCVGIRARNQLAERSRLDLVYNCDE